MLNSKPLIVLSRIDSIGDVVLTLPVAGVLKDSIPGCRIVFIGRNYTQPVVIASEFIDEFLSYDELLALSKGDAVARLANLQAACMVHVFPNRFLARLAQQAKIPLRIGTRNRWFHWLTCNQLASVSRRHSELHESQLNLQLLKPLLGAATTVSLAELPQYYGLNRLQPLPAWVATLRDPKRFGVIIHPKSKGSARDWPLEYWIELLRILPSQRIQFFMTGSKAEQELLSPIREAIGSQVIDLSGQLSLDELIAVIGTMDGLIACSTGPLHLAAALGRTALGLFPPLKPMHPGRWRPVGVEADFLVADRECHQCLSPANCACMRALDPSMVANRLLQCLEKLRPGD